VAQLGLLARYRLSQVDLGECDDAIAAEVAPPPSGARVGVCGIAGYFLAPPSRPGLVLGYSRMNQEKIREGIRLCEAFTDLGH
jgi:hypothetical protein